MEVDFIIVGQGICGTLLSWNLWKEGAKILVIDEAKNDTASKVASGVINPVTGKRIVRSWMIEELLPIALDTYFELGNEFGKTIIQQCNILNFYANKSGQDTFLQRVSEDATFISEVINESSFQALFNFNNGIGLIHPCYLIDLKTILENWRERLLEQQLLLEAYFEWNYGEILPEGVNYKGIKARKIIFCEGVSAFNNPYFNRLPFSKNKGEAIIASIPGLPRNNIYKQDFQIVPWKDDLFWIGSSFDWNYQDVLPTINFKNKVIEKLNDWLKIPYEITDHIVAERPATVGQQPFIGFHPIYSSIGIFNGMGSKGCSLAPYFSRQIAAHLLHRKSILPAADIARFSKILSG